MASRTYRTEAVVLRSIRLGEADCVLHLFTLERGRVGAVAKGVRKTRSRFGARLEPLSHVDLWLHQGSGELQTVTGAELIRPHSRAREDACALHVGLIGLEAMLRLFSEQEANPRAFEALTRFLDVLDTGVPATSRRSRPAFDPLALSFQLKLLWLAGYMPHLRSCVECGSEGPLVGYSPAAGGAVCEVCGGALDLAPESLAGMDALLRRPLAEAPRAGLSERARRDCLRVISASYEYHGGFRLRTLAGS